MKMLKSNQWLAGQKASEVTSELSQKLNAVNETFFTTQYGHVSMCYTCTRQHGIIIP